MQLLLRMAAASIAAGSLTGTSRLLQIDTTLGTDALIVRNLSGHEALSEMFTVEVDLASENFQIAASALVAQPVTLRVMMSDSEERFINGIVSRFTLIPTRDRLAHYRARIVPDLWLLTRTTNCCIFQNKSIPEIVEAIFQRYGITKYELQLTKKYTKLEYCVQYRESAFDFISRLLEEEGICYYFEHTQNSHTIVLSDSPQGHPACKLDAEVLWEPGAGGGFNPQENYVTDWARTVEVRPRKWTQGDFQFKQPALNLVNTVPTVSKVPGPDLERYDYPGRFSAMPDGEQLTRTRIEEEEASVDTIVGESTCRGFVPGFTFKMKQSFRADQAGRYLLCSLSYQAEQGSLYAGDPNREQRYVNSFTAIPAETTFRPARVTPRPFIRGPQTAFVTGPKGEEMYVDQYGRIKVQFHWDREGSFDDVSSCWLRVSQSVAGKGWGSLQLPRVGHEVIVTFLEGDPDRPVVTGSLYNADHIVPYKLPNEVSKTTFKTLSYPGGGGFNELRLDDKKGNEQVFLHGEKDLDIRIKNDSREWIGRDRHLIVQRDKIEQVTRDKHETIQRDQVEKITRDHHLAVSGKEAISISGSHSMSVQGDVIEKFGGSQSTQVSGACYLKGMNVVIEAMTGLTIKVGGSYVTINAAGVQITGPMVMINSGGAALSGSAGSPVSPIAPLEAALADDGKPGDKGRMERSGKAASGGSGAGGAGSAGAATANAPWHDPASAANKDKKSWIEIELLDGSNKPVPGEPYRVTLPDGQTLAEGTLDNKGVARVEGIDPGNCKVTFPQRDKRSWKPK